MSSLNDILRYRIGHILAPHLAGGEVSMPRPSSVQVPWITIVLALLAVICWED
jgi:hypothetical protein